MVTGRSGSILVTGPSSVKAGAIAFLEFKVNLFTFGRGEERVWKLWQALDPTFPALRVCATWSISYFPVSLWAVDLALGVQRREPEFGGRRGTIRR